MSQSGETADTLAALRLAKKLNYLDTLAICNVSESTLTREANHIFLMRAGIEIGVASTKAFTTQLIALLLFTLTLGKGRQLPAQLEKIIITQLHGLSAVLNQLSTDDKRIEQLAHKLN